jgi:hypothetical protein
MEYPLHIVFSNQSFDIPVADVIISLDGDQVVHQELTTGTQHTWEQIETSVVQGRHRLDVLETKSQIHKSETITSDRELWVVVAFQTSPTQFKINTYDHPIAFM